MYYINNSRVDFPENWERRSEDAKYKVMEGEINCEARDYIWKELKLQLADCSNDKCWYCETAIPRTDNAVDHFRPKGTVQGLSLAYETDELNKFNLTPEHKGYKWLAFDFDNFRYSCQHCNEYRKDLEGTCGGKWNYFPLLDESDRGYIEGDEHYEEPILLDPCNPEDWELLSFNRDGKPFSRFENGSENDLRVRYSIRIYHLDSKRLNESRVSQWKLLRPKVSKAKKAFLRRIGNKPGAKADFSNSLKEITQFMDSQNKSLYRGFLLYQLEIERESDDNKIHSSWINTIIRSAK
ncbi:hypothetical protein [Alteromonas lipotrueae]|uniref:hypothetical protein n=1 Tax=Alteromonas lipotrueae TaxID=2803814 RepID=UPI001C490858|nr:hypothetical protein [Alteromonas lipotrueae]